MSLRARLAFTLALLAAVTAAGVAAAGFSVTSRRLNQQINVSLSDYVNRLSERSGEVAYRVCGGRSGSPADLGLLPGPAPRGRGRDAQDRVPSGLTIQCLDTTGAVTFTGAGGSLPVDGSDVKVAAGGGQSISARTIKVDGTDTQIRTVPIPGLGAVQVARSLEENTRLLGSLLSRYLMLAGIATVVAAAAGVLLARQTVKPLVNLTVAAERIASTGDLSLDVPVHQGTRDEAGRLGKAFVTMVEALRGSREQQARLVQDAGHELRTPLTSMRTNVSLLRRADLPEAKRANILDAVHHELIELTDLTNELVALAAESTDPEPVRTVELDEVVERCVQRFRRRTGRELEVHLDPVIVNGQPAALARAVDNLLGNAHKFAPAGTTVHVTLQVDGSVDAPLATLRVRDHGPGVAPGDRERIFERFYRSDEARTLPGSGLGLAIVHDTVVAHSGTVVVTNASDGGAVFSVQLPAIASTSGR